jgi:fused signal recognition particle receptor
MWGIFGSSKEEEPTKSTPQAPAQPSFWQRIKKQLVGKTTIDEDTLDALEEALITADVSLHTTTRIITRLEECVAQEHYTDIKALYKLLKEEINQLIQLDTTPEATQEGLCITLVIGVNGVGKTTTIAKLAARRKKEGKDVLIAAADTFRAAAVAQVEAWGQRIDVPVVSRGMHVSPSTVVYEALTKALATDTQELIIDTAGRLHNKLPLMDELAKVGRVIAKRCPNITPEVLLVVDGNTGQNALQQAKAFATKIGVTGLVITKLDGASKGGILISLAAELNIPIKYIGTGEGVADLHTFDTQRYLDSLFAQQGL